MTSNTHRNWEKTFTKIFFLWINTFCPCFSEDTMKKRHKKIAPFSVSSPQTYLASPRSISMTKTRLSFLIITEWHYVLSGTDPKHCFSFCMYLLIVVVAFIKVFLIWLLLWIWIPAACLSMYRAKCASFMLIEILWKLLMPFVSASNVTKVSGSTEDLDMTYPFSIPHLASWPLGLWAHIFVPFIKCFPQG